LSTQERSSAFGRALPSCHLSAHTARDWTSEIQSNGEFSAMSQFTLTACKMELRLFSAMWHGLLLAWPASSINATEPVRASVRTAQGPVSETGDVLGVEEMLLFSPFGYSV